MSRKLVLITIGLAAVWIWLGILVLAQTAVDSSIPPATSQHLPLLSAQSLPGRGPDVQASAAMTTTPYARANMLTNAVDGYFGPNAEVTYSVIDNHAHVKCTATGTATPSGFFGPLGCTCDMVPGDTVRVVSDQGFDADLLLISITGHLDIAADKITGQMQGGVFPGNGYVTVWSDGRQNGVRAAITINGSGSYVADLAHLAEPWDLWVGDTASVWYTNAEGNDVGTEFRTLRTYVNYGQDLIQAQTMPMTAVTITVVGKATFIADTDGSGGLDTSSMPEAWEPAPPDIQPGDVVRLSALGYLLEINPVGRISILASPIRDIVTGRVEAPPFTEPLSLHCVAWGSEIPIIDETVDPDGGSYTCDFGIAGGDLVLGQTVLVYYSQPDGSLIYNAVHAGANTVSVPLVVKKR